MHHMFVQVRTKTSIFSQNVTEALVIFPEPPRMFSHLFQKKSNKQKSPSIFTIKIQTTLLTVPPPPFSTPLKISVGPAVDWKENAIPATTRRHKQLVINTGPSPRRSQGDAIPSPPPGTQRLRMVAWKKLILLLDAEFVFFDLWETGEKYGYDFFWGGIVIAICEAISGGRGFSLGFLVGEDDMLDGGMVYRYIQ